MEMRNLGDQVSNCDSLWVPDESLKKASFSVTDGHWPRTFQNVKMPLKKAGLAGSTLHFSGVKSNYMVSS